ncbi:site-2 protease family protein [Roseovarius faecimaris]|nr:site-2 protease family protein [Roseovarius faecimaris]
MFQDSTPVFEFRGPLGIPVQIGSSLALLVAFYLFVAGANLFSALIIVMMLLAAIFLHELGHAWASEVQGVPVRRIVLYGGGGFCENKRSATAYEQEFIVVMGPIVNLALWALCSLGAYWLWEGIIADGSFVQIGRNAPIDPRITLAQHLELFAMINGFLAVFNLIPVQPLDGGKLLHLILLRLTHAEAAMKITGRIGLILSVLWIPGLIFFYGMGWWILFFIPSIPLHFAMARGRLA